MADRLFYTVVIVSMLIAIVIIFFVVSVIRYHKRYIQLQKERIQAQIMIQEQERKRIANDLHDSLGPMLSTVKLYMQSITVENDADKQSLHKASDYIDESIGNLREISYNLLPGSLTRNGLVTVVKEFLTRLSGKHAIKISFEAGKNLNLPENTELHLFRIIQETVHNAIKHSGATALNLKLTRQPEGLFLLAEDNGKGFDPHQLREASKGLGLKSIENRCEMIDASLKIVSQKNEGCKIIIKISDR